MPSKILVVDDDPDILDAVTMILESQGYQVFTARDGIEGLATLKAEKAKEEGVKIILEIIEQLKEIPGVQGIHIMAVGWEDIVPEIVEKAGLMPRPVL